jgi:lipoprotein-releasing system permease protein
MSAVARLAWRHLAAAPRPVALTVAGVAVGVAVFIFTVAMMDGLVIFFSQRILRISPTLTVLPERLETSAARLSLQRSADHDVLVLSRPPVPDQRPTLRGAPGLASQLAALPGVTGVSLAAAPAGVISFGTVPEGAVILGLDPVAEQRVTELWRLVVEGSWDALAARRDGVILGVNLAERLGAQVGDRVLAAGEGGTSKELEVVGILAAGVGALDESTAIVNLPVAQGLAGWGGDEASEIRLRTAQFTGLEELRRRARELAAYRVDTWQESNRAALQLFRTIGLTTYLLTGFVLVVAGLGIGNRLATMILDKERDIAILRAYGFSGWAVRGVFVLEGLLMGVAGALAGCLVAAVAIAYLQAFPIRFARREGAALAYTELYLANDPRYYLLIAAVAVVIALLAAALAVRRAVRVLPVEVLRGMA